MKKIIYLITLLALLLVACGKDEKSFNFTVDEYESTLKSIIDKNKGNSFIEMKSKTLVDDNYQIELAKGITIVVKVNDDNKVTSVYGTASSDALLVYNKELKIAYLALIKSVDGSLGTIQQFTVFEKLGITGDSKMLDHSGTYNLNDVSYVFKGDIENNTLILKAEPK
ncbi:hypothetical protein B1B04_18980 [Lysinibacillus sp. KCTC 33748]|uniref:hypothetical protein n=1 Tax=unclassified Lysinibacillus TaxID=2636778 RepID=UPI0009A61AD3|nr:MULTISPECIES: hypothetical protein [unclassified Lysinibacillus]OXS70246.1 hypothetical protein B1B04_18980 [Lysinibacillus sp. KCTC 33748]SKC05185.1 hypothetical protein SAMN06295926_11985 [Lysinibacillus sp. AC-3]